MLTLLLITRQFIFATVVVITFLRGEPLEIPGREGGYKIFAARFFFSVSCLCRNFFMHLTSARIFFKDYLHFAVCLHDFFASDVMAARIFFQAFFFARIFFGIFNPPSRDF